MNRDGIVNTGNWEVIPGETRSSKETTFEVCHLLQGVDAAGLDGEIAPKSGTSYSTYCLGGS
jgi:uncharacterized cupin superfamily protein